MITEPIEPTTEESSGSTSNLGIWLFVLICAAVVGATVGLFVFIPDKTEPVLLSSRSENLPIVSLIVHGITSRGEKFVVVQVMFESGEPYKKRAQIKYRLVSSDPQHPGKIVPFLYSTPGGEATPDPDHPEQSGTLTTDVGGMAHVIVQAPAKTLHKVEAELDGRAYSTPVFEMTKGDLIDPSYFMRKSEDLNLK